MKRLKRYFSKNYLPRWIIFLFDLTVIFLSWFVAFLLRFNFDLSNMEESIHPIHLAIIFPVFIFCFLKSKSYAGILRHSTIKDIMRVIISVISGGITLALISFIVRRVGTPAYTVMPYSVIVIFVLLVSTTLSLSRLLAKLLFQYWNNNKKTAKNIMIFGAGQLGQATHNAILMNTSTNYEVVGFIENNTSLHDKYISGIPIFSVRKAFNKIIKENNVSEIIFAVEKPKISNKQKRKITDKCLNMNLLVKEVPALNTWINGELNTNNIKPIRIEDLLGRNSIQLDRIKIEQGLKNSVVLITGAAGSIGSEIVRQLISFKVKRVILLDKAESDLYNLQQEIIAKKEITDFVAVVGDITNETKLRKVFMKYAPTIVFNAAAYKHVPLMEAFPAEAVRVNIGGVQNVANLSIEFGIEKFVLISTDKAVNPTNVMGATKRISEMYIQALAQSGRYTTQFITTRFGNVLGSNGSVVPLFKKQIEKGGPVTVTHKDITRYFMTIPEACQLVLEAGFMGKGGEIFVFDMGEPIRIYDLAKKMISLSGFVPKKDIKIKVTGLRPGEKLYEELISNKELLLNHTHNDKIMIGKDRKHDLRIMTLEIKNLLKNIDIKSSKQLVGQLMRIVPEFISINSDYKNGESEESTLAGRQKYIGRIARKWDISQELTKKLYQKEFEKTEIAPHKGV